MQNLLNYILSISNNQMYIIYIIVIIISFLLYFFPRYIILKSISKIFKKTKTEFDDILVERGVLNRLSYFIPLVFIYNLKDLIAVHEIVDRVLISLITLIIISSFNAFINVLNDFFAPFMFKIHINVRRFIPFFRNESFEQ